MFKPAFFLLVAVLLLVFAAPLFAVTFDEVIEMNEAGVSTDVIVALIETTGSVFDLSVEDVVLLEESGLDDQVILAMIRESNQPQDENDLYLQLSDDEFRNMFLIETPEVTNVSDTEVSREPQYYHSNPSPTPRQYVSYPDRSAGSYDNYYSNGYGYSYDYGYSSPGYYSRSQKVYRATYYPGTYFSHYPVYYSYPLYYTYGDRGYYPTSYSPAYYPASYYRGHYPGYSYSGSYYYPYGHICNSGCGHYGYGHRNPGSRVKVRSHNDDWYFALGFSF